MSLKKKKFIYYAIIFAMVALMVLAVFVVDDIPGMQDVSNYIVMGAFIGILLDIVWILTCFRCPDCGARLRMNSMFSIKECPKCKKKIDIRFFD